MEPSKRARVDASLGLHERYDGTNIVYFNPEFQEKSQKYKLIEINDDILSCVKKGWTFTTTMLSLILTCLFGHY